ncbi:MAG: DUF3524 domain-containing protein, partial [Cyanobacteria bacterium J06576_12]
MIIHLFAPFFSGSHQRWASEYARFSEHDVRLFTLPGRHWKWRMHGAAVELARQFLDQPEQPDLILTTDMLDTATFLALTRARTANVPVAVYFHENQLTYPWSPTDEDVAQKRDRHYAWINYTSALAADAVFFNSQYHHDSFLGALPAFLKVFPDYKGLGTVTQIADKSSVLYLGMDLRAFDPIEARYKSDIPVLLWNHRWEYDKDPEAFFACCEQLHDEGLDFRLIILGESYANRPAVFDAVKEKLSAKTLHWGYAEGFADYAGLVKSAHILPVTSRQDFFGGSVVEAMYCGVYPLLPDRLAFGEHVPEGLQQD